MGEGPGRFRVRFGHPPVFVVAWVGRDERGKERLRQVVAEEWARWSGSGGGVVHLFHALPVLTPETALGWKGAEEEAVSLLGGK